MTMMASLYCRERFVGLTREDWASTLRHQRGWRRGTRRRWYRRGVKDGLRFAGEKEYVSWVTR